MNFTSKKRLTSLIAGIARRVQAVNEDRAPGMVVIAPVIEGQIDQAFVDRQIAQRRYPPEAVIVLPDNGRGDYS